MARLETDGLKYAIKFLAGLIIALRTTSIQQ